MIEPTHSGKVRDSYKIDSERMLVVASDRISVFDVVLPSQIPGKGQILTAMTEFWLQDVLGDIPNHLITTDMTTVPSDLLDATKPWDRGMVVRTARMLPIECIVRGFLYGSVMGEYAQHGTASGVELPSGLVKASRLPEPIFTPSTKAAAGHDENITMGQAEQLVHPSLLARIRRWSLEIYQEAAAHALTKGIILADTKFEFGLVDGQLTLCDEVLTPDSSRFWELDTWSPGTEPTSFDKQFVRKYCEETGWNKQPPGPVLPEEVIAATQAKYDEAYGRLTAA